MNAVIRAGFVALALVATGCSGGQPLDVWKTSVEQYIDDEANHDPGALRNVADRPSQREFGVIGASKTGMPLFSSTRTDVTGVLVGHRNVAARWWFVFLVGSVTYHGNGVVFPLDDPSVGFIRLAAMSAEDGSYAWIMGEDDRQALATYVESQLAAWRRSHPSRSDAEQGPTVFPSDQDAMQLTLEGGTIRVTDERSGATWTIEIPTAVAADTDGAPKT